MELSYSFWKHDAMMRPPRKIGENQILWLVEPMGDPERNGGGDRRPNRDFRSQMGGPDEDLQDNMGK